MALTTSPLCSSNLPNKLLEGRSRLSSCLVLYAWHCPISVKCYIKPPKMAQFHEPAKLKMHVNYVKEKLWEIAPDSVKAFEWKKAETTVVHQLLTLGKQLLKKSLIALFILSTILDVVYSFSINRELIVPFGLLFGCLITDFLKETTQELFPNLEDKGLSWHLYSVGCLFVFVKLVSTYFAVGRRVFLLHFANGGLMQVLWLWRCSMNMDITNDRQSSSLTDEATSVISQD